MKDYTLVVLNDLYAQVVNETIVYPSKYTKKDKCSFLSELKNQYEELGEFDKCKQLNSVMEKMSC